MPALELSSHLLLHCMQHCFTTPQVFYIILIVAHPQSTLTSLVMFPLHFYKQEVISETATPTKASRKLSLIDIQTMLPGIWDISAALLLA